METRPLLFLSFTASSPFAHEAHLCPRRRGRSLARPAGARAGSGSGSRHPGSGRKPRRRIWRLLHTILYTTACAIDLAASRRTGDRAARFYITIRRFLVNLAGYILRRLGTSTRKVCSYLITCSWTWDPRNPLKALPADLRSAMKACAASPDRPFAVLDRVVSHHALKTSKPGQVGEQMIDLFLESWTPGRCITLDRCHPRARPSRGRSRILADLWFFCASGRARPAACRTGARGAGPARGPMKRR